MNKFKINPLVLAIAVAMPATVYAQTQSEQIDEIVVSGFRASQAKALDAKREATGSVDAIMASDIAEFPDNNLAESLQRIPGVAITRSGGEGRNISVRGLSAQYTRIRINGMETSTTTGGTDATGGNNRGRSFDFNVFSSDLFSSLVVHKTGSADVDEGSLGATVDMRAARPFDYEGFVFTANGQLGYNDLSKKNDPTAGFLISNKFADGTVGALLSFSHSERSIQDEGSSTVRWSNLATEKFGKYKGVTVLATDPLTTAFHPRIPRYDSYHTDLSRDGLSASLQFKPTDSTEISLDALLSRYEATRTEKFIEASMNGTQNANVNILDYEIRGKSLVYASMTGARVLGESRQDEMTTDYSMYTLNAKHEFNDRFRIDGLIGVSRSDFENPLQNTIIMQANNQDLTWDYRNGDTRLTFGDGAFNKASAWTVNSVRQRPQATNNDYDTGAFNLGFDLNDTFTLKAGAAHKKFLVDTWQTAYLGGEGASGNCTATGNTTAANTASPACGIDLTAADSIIEYDSGLGQDKPWLLPNRALLMEKYGLFDKPMTIAESSTARAGTFDVTETTDSEYVQLEFKTQVAGLPLRGDFGVRHFTTDQKSSGWVKRGTTWGQEYITRSYSDTLPSLNLVLEPTDDVVLRAAYSEGIARANMGNLTNDTNITYTGSNRAITINNPYLNPSKAKSFDLSAEWYFAPESAISVGLFRKKVDTFVQTVADSLTFAELGLSTDLAVGACGTSYSTAITSNCNESLKWGVSRPTNAPGGTINGFEISYQQPFTFLPGFLQDFGFIGSFTHVKSDMNYITSSTTTSGTDIITTTSLTQAPLLSLSPNSSSATIYYEKNAFKGRISVAKRDGYLTLAVNDSNGNYQNGTNGTTNVDAQISYDINEHFKVSLDMLNLTNEIDDQWVESSEPRLSYVHETGRQYNLGVNYKF